jgi:hypothetical protein
MGALPLLRGVFAGGPTPLSLGGEGRDHSSGSSTARSSSSRFFISLTMVAPTSSLKPLSALSEVGSSACPKWFLLASRRGVQVHVWRCSVGHHCNRAG